MMGYFQNHTTWKEMLGKGKSKKKKKTIGASAAKGWKKSSRGFRYWTSKDFLSKGQKTIRVGGGCTSPPIIQRVNSILYKMFNFSLTQSDF